MTPLEPNWSLRQFLANCLSRGDTYNVDSDNTAVVVDSEAVETNVGGQSLGKRLLAQSGGLQEGWDGACNEDTTSRIEFGRDVIGQEGLQKLLGGLGSVLGDLFKGAVGGSKDSVVGSGAVEGLYEIIVLADEFGKLRGVLARRNELVHRLVWLVRVGAVVAMVAMPECAVVFLLFIDVFGRLQPALRVKVRLVDAVVGLSGGVLDPLVRFIEGGLCLGGVIVKGRLDLAGDAVEGVFNVFGSVSEDTIQVVDNLRFGGNSGLDFNIFEVGELLVRQHECSRGRGQGENRRELHLCTLFELQRLKNERRIRKRRKEKEGESHEVVVVLLLLIVAFFDRCEGCDAGASSMTRSTTGGGKPPDSSAVRSWRDAAPFLAPIA